MPATLPADWPAPFVANVASPGLRVFPAQQPNGQAVLVIPGGGYQFVSVENEGADFAARLNARGYTVFVLVVAQADRVDHQRMPDHLADE